MKKRLFNKITRIVLASLGVLVLFFFTGWSESPFLKEPSTVNSSLAKRSEPVKNIFSSFYPVSPRFVKEISEMRTQDKVSFNIENSIHTSILTTAEELEIPPALLWCLIFQESRLNPLSGAQQRRLSKGIGQFSPHAFFEVNHHLYKYMSSPQAVFSSILGLDVRPIKPDLSNTSAIHSYYFIPTGITATALYLHNRWTQLSRVARARDLSFSKDILWGWAALSYNKGGRTIINMWREIEKDKGTPYLQSTLSAPQVFLAEATNLKYIQAAVSTIWPKKKTGPYAQELRIHSENIKECSFSPSVSKQGGSQ